VQGLIGVVGVGPRSVAYDSLSILEIHPVGKRVNIRNPVISSLQNNCTVLFVKFETFKHFIFIPELNLTNLSLWLVDLNEGQVVFCYFCAAIDSIFQSELVSTIECFIDGDKIVFVVELVDGWKVSVLLAAPDRHVRIRVSPVQFFGKLVL